MTLEDLLIEFWSWHYLANPHQEEAEDTEFDLDKVTDAMSDPDPDKWQEV